MNNTTLEYFNICYKPTFINLLLTNQQFIIERNIKGGIIGVIKQGIIQYF